MVPHALPHLAFLPSSNNLAQRIVRSLVNLNNGSYGGPRIPQLGDPDSTANAVDPDRLDAPGGDRHNRPVGLALDGLKGVTRGEGYAASGCCHRQFAGFDSRWRRGLEDRVGSPSSSSFRFQNLARPGSCFLKLVLAQGTLNPL